jgi:hypothetical protein
LNLSKQTKTVGSAKKAFFFFAMFHPIKTVSRYTYA